MNINLLKESPMFNVSLASKELFHSNFIDWVITIKPESMSILFSNLLKNKIKIINCNREKNNFDLYIDCEDNKQIIIENKFKSIIGEDQLIRYNEKLKDKNSLNVLLSLNLTNYEKDLSKKYNWIAISYSELSSELKKIIFKNKYHQLIVKDYCEFIDEISKYFLNRDFSGHKIKEMYKEYELLSEIKLHDVYQKILFNYILQKLNSKLHKNIINNSKISSWQDFWRGTGLVSLSYAIVEEKERRSGFEFELQLQYDALKLMLIHENPREKLTENFKKNYFQIIENISKSNYCRKSGELFPNRQNMDYKKYGSNLIYKNIILSENLTMLEIVDKMYSIFKEVIDYGEKYFPK